MFGQFLETSPIAASLIWRRVILVPSLSQESDESGYLLIIMTTTIMTATIMTTIMTTTIMTTTIMTTTIMT